MAVHTCRYCYRRIHVDRTVVQMGRPVHDLYVHTDTDSAWCGQPMESDVATPQPKCDAPHPSANVTCVRPELHVGPHASSAAMIGTWE